MTEEQIERALQTNRVQLSSTNKLTHFAIVGIIFLIPFFVLWSSISGFFAGDERSLTNGDLLIISVSIFIGLFFYKIQSDRLTFTEIPTPLPRAQIISILEKIAHELDWYAEDVQDRYIIAKTTPSPLSGSWGERITILFDQERILVNSISDPNMQNSIIPMGRNKRNIQRLVDAIHRP